MFSKLLPSLHGRTMSRKGRWERILVQNSYLSFVKNNSDSVGLYVAADPLSSDHYYFEVEIISRGQIGAIGVGLVPNNYPLDAQPGWRVFSVGYHADDGGIFEGIGTGRPFGPKCVVGDRMGCGINFMQSNAGMVEVFFTKNDRKIGTVSATMPPGGLFPAVGMHSEGEQVRLDLNADFSETNVSPQNLLQTLTRPTTSRKANWERICVQNNYLSFVTNDLNLVGLYVAAEPLTSDHSYFEIEINSTGQIGAIGVGLVPNNYPMHAQPGWNEFSVGYHADDGKLFQSSGRGRPFGPKCTVGDRMGCGINFMQSKGGTVEVFFTKNNQKIGTVSLTLSTGGLFPAVGMHSKGEKVLLDLNADFKDTNISGCEDTQLLGSSASKPNHEDDKLGEQELEELRKELEGLKKEEEQLKESMKRKRAIEQEKDKLKREIEERRRQIESLKAQQLTSSEFETERGNLDEGQTDSMIYEVQGRKSQRK